MDSRIIRRGEAFLLEVNGETLPLYGYLTYQPEKGCYEAFKKTGVRLFFCTMYAGDRGINQSSGIRPFRSGFWKGYGQYDFSEVDADLHRICGASRPGEIFILPRLMVEVPSWWDAENPDEVCRDAHGMPVHQSFHSKKWLADVEHMFADLYAWVTENGWDRYIIGWHMAAGNTEEFIRPELRQWQLTDYSRPAQEAFRRWTEHTYGGSIAALNAAWHRHYGDFSEVSVPAPFWRQYALDGAYRNEVGDRMAIDYYTFLNEDCARAAVGLCQAAKRVTGGRQVIGAFYGYLACGSENGQTAAELVYGSDSVDFIASPFSYEENRAPGMDWPPHGALESAAAHGKPWFMEADVRTHLSRPISQAFPKADPYVNRAYDGPVWYGPDTVEGSLGQMKKAFSRVLTHNTAIWWFDMWGGWYDDERYMAFLAQAYTLYSETMLAGGCRSTTETALFMDNAAFYRFTSGAVCWLNHQAVWKPLGYLGAPYKLFLLSDLDRVDPREYRMAIFSASCTWTPEQLRTLEKWKGDGRILAFLGWGNNTPASGVPVQTENELECLPSDQRMGRVETRVRRLVPRRDDVILESDERGVLALLRREAEHAVYVQVPSIPDSDRMRALLSAAGGHIYTPGGDVAYAGGDYIAVHAASDGCKRILSPDKCRLVDVCTGKALPGNECYADVNMKKGETVLLRMEKPE